LQGFLEVCRQKQEDREGDDERRGGAADSVDGVNLNSLENNKTNSQKEYEEALKTADYFGYSFPENKTLKQNTWSLLKSIF
jgi:hypothetical protein